MAVPRNDFYTLSGMNRTEDAPRAFPYNPKSAAWTVSIFPPPDNPFGGALNGTAEQILQGEMVALPATGTTVPPMSVVRWNGDQLNLRFLGIARDSMRAAQRLLGYLPTTISVWTGGIHRLRTTNGETYENDALVKMNTSTNDTDQIKLGSALGADAIGRVLLPKDVDFIVGDGKVRVPILIDTFLK